MLTRLCSGVPLSFSPLPSLSPLSFLSFLLIPQIKYRMRIVPVSPERGWGVWLLEDVPAGTLLFEYAGEIITPSIAAAREHTYASNLACGRHYIQACRKFQRCCST